MKQIPAEADRMLQAMQVLVDDFRRDAAALHRALVDSMPGYPTSTLGGSGSSGGQVSDPTGRMALEGDTAGADLALWYSSLESAHLWLVEAFHVRSRHRPATAVVKRCGNPNGCPGHRLAEKGRGGLCQPCHRARPVKSEAG